MGSDPVDAALAAAGIIEKQSRKNAVKFLAAWCSAMADRNQKVLDGSDHNGVNEECRIVIAEYRHQAATLRESADGK